MTKLKRGTRGMNRNAVSCGFFIALTTLSGCYEEYGGAKQAPESSLSRPRVELGGISIELLPNVTPATEEVLDHFQEAHRCELPDVYRQFLMKSNGGIPTQDCIEFVEAGRTTFTDILCFHAIGDQSSHNSVDWHLELFEGRIPKDTLPIARDSWGNLWLLVTRGKASGKIYFWDHGSYDTFDETDLKQWPLVADSFQDFMRSLKTYLPPATAQAVPSRYEIVQRARTSLTTGKSDGLDYAWHGAVKNDGRFVVEYVEYKVHARFSHTDGYTRLRAESGLIPEGETRLPK